MKHWIILAATLLCTLVLTLPSTAAVPLQVQKIGTGKGTITSNPIGVNCKASCVLDYLYVATPGTTVVFTAIPDAGSQITKWNVPGCSGTTCTLTATVAQTVTVTIDKIPGFIPPTTTITVAPTTFVFTAQVNGPQPAKQSLTITTTAAWSVSQVPSWLKLSLLKPNVLSLAISQTGLAAGVYNGTLLIKAPNLTSISVPVKLTVTTTPVTTPGFSVDKSTITITGRQFGQTGTNPPPQTIIVNGVTTFTATSPTSWIRIDPFKGYFNIQALLPGLIPGQYQGQVLVTTTEVSSPVSQIVLVTLTVTPAPTILAFPTTLNFQAASTLPAPKYQTVWIANQGTGSLGTLGVNAGGPLPAWLSLSTTPSSVVATVNPSGLADGVYTRNITITSSTALNKSVTIPITLQVVPSTAIVPSGTATLTWLANPADLLAPTEGYRVYRSTTSGVYTDPFIATIPHPINNYELLKDMPLGGTYFFTLTAYNSGGESLRSNEVFITFPIPLP